MTVLGGVEPKFKGTDDLSITISDFYAFYELYMTAYNTYIQYLLDEKELIRARDSEGLITVRQTAAAALETTNAARSEVRMEWLRLKMTWRRFNRGKML